MDARPEDLAERIDTSFGTGPHPLPPLDDLLTRGHRARRRRRAGIGALAAAAVTAVAVGSLLLAPAGGERARDGNEYVAPTAASATPPPVPSADPTGRTATTATTAPLDRAEQIRLMDKAVVFRADGGFTLAPGATVLERIDNPYDAVAPAWSVGLRVSYHGFEFWTAQSGPGDGSFGGAHAGPDPTGSFARFVAGENPGGAGTEFVGPDVWPDVVQLDPVRMATGGVRLTALPGFTVLDQQGPVDAGTAWAGPTDDTAAALVRADDGTTYFVLARRLDAKTPQYVVVPQSGNGEDLASFLELARTRYAIAR